MAMALSYTMEITEKEIQQRVTAMMPIQVTKSMLTVNILDPQVRLLKESDEVAVASPLEMTVPGWAKASGYINVKGSISYDALTGEFFLKNPTISEIEIKGLPEKYRPYAKEAAQLAIGRSLATRPIYTLRDDDLKQKLAKAVIQSVTVKNQKVLVVLGV